MNINAAIAKYFLKWDTAQYPAFSEDPMWTLEVLGQMGPGYHVGLNPDPSAPDTQRWRCFKYGSKEKTYAPTLGIAVCKEALKKIGFLK